MEWNHVPIPPPPGFVPLKGSEPIRTHVPIQYPYHRLTKDDTNNFFEWTARHEAPMVLDSGESRPWRKGDPPIPKDVVMWIDHEGRLHNVTTDDHAAQLASQSTAIAALQTQVAALTAQLQALTQASADRVG